MNRHMNWLRVIAISGVVVGVLAAAAATPLVVGEWRDWQARREAVPRPIIATDAQQRDILRVLLSGDGFEGVPPPPPLPGQPPAPRTRQAIVLLDISPSFCRDAETGAPQPEACASSSFTKAILFQDNGNPIPLKLREELVAANVIRTNIPDPGIGRVIYFPTSGGRLHPADQGWEAFYAQFPSAAAVVDVSRAILSKDGQHAVIYAGQSCGGLCGNGGLHYFVRSGESWREIEKVGLWIS